MKWATCKHDRGFALHVFTCADRLPVYFCLHNCGFTLSFDPDVAGVFKEPHHILLKTRIGEERWRQKTMAYSFNRREKTITLATSKF